MYYEYMNEKFAECDLFRCWNFFFFRLKTSWDSRIEPLFIQESSRSALSDGSTLKRGCWGRGLGSKADYFGRRAEEGN